MRRILMLAVTVLGLGATGAAAQLSQTADVSFSATIPTLLSISAASSFTFDPATEADYTNTYMESTGGPTLTHFGNVNYKITAQASGATLTGGTGTKPVSDVTLTGGSEGAKALVSGSPVTVHQRNKGGSTTTALGARMALSYANDAPGTYETTITFTIAAQ